ETKRKAGEGAVRPGDDVDVTITATDPQGKPVAAEGSLALVEQSLVDVFGSNVAPIQDFFRGQPREAAVRTMSSVTFAYRPDTRPIDPKLLAEKDRLEVAAEEAERLKAMPPLVVQGMAGGGMGGEGKARLSGRQKFRHIAGPPMDDASEVEDL